MRSVYLLELCLTSEDFVSDAGDVLGEGELTILGEELSGVDLEDTCLDEDRGDSLTVDGLEVVLGGEGSVLLGLFGGDDEILRVGSPSKASSATTGIVEPRVREVRAVQPLKAAASTLASLGASTFFRVLYPSKTFALIVVTSGRLTAPSLISFSG